MPRTRADLIVEALDLLGVSQAGQAPSAEDVEAVDRQIDGKFAELARRHVIYVANADEIDDEFFLPLARVVANAAAPKFSQPRDPGVDLDAEATLRALQMALPRPSSPLRADYF